MDGEDGGDRPCAGRGQPFGQAPEKQGVGNVQENVDDVVTGRSEPPQLVL